MDVEDVGEAEAEPMDTASAEADGGGAAVAGADPADGTAAPEGLSPGDAAAMAEEEEEEDEDNDGGLAPALQSRIAGMVSVQSSRSSTVYPPTRRPYSPRIAAQCGSPEQRDGPNHLGLCARQVDSQLVEMKSYLLESLAELSLPPNPVRAVLR